jgi:NTE family protein
VSDPIDDAMTDANLFEGASPPTLTERLRARWAQRRHGADRRHPVPKRTAFVLAGGGSRGAVQVGMLQELIRRGIRADRVYGASVGAINGASYAGQPTLENAERMADIWRAVKGTDIFPRGPLDGPWAFLQKRPSVHANSGLRAIIEAGIDYEDLEDATIPIEVVTTSLTDGRERWIGHGPAVEAILASSAIPSIFPPVTIDGDLLVDGGVVNNVPISRALSAGCDRIYVLLCGPLHYHPRAPRRPLEAQLTAFFVAIHARFVRELALLPPGVEVVVFSGGGEPSGQYRDFSGTATLIEEGRAEVADVLDRYVGTSQDLVHPVTPPTTAEPPPAAGTPTAAPRPGGPPPSGETPPASGTPTTTSAPAP